MKSPLKNRNLVIKNLPTLTDSYQNLMGNSDNVKNELDKIPARSIHGKLINFEKTVRPIA